jgi:ribonuclease J
MPIYAGTLNRKYYQDMAIEEGWKRENTIMAKNGDSILFTADKWEKGPEVPAGSILVDQNAQVVSGIVVKDRIMLSEEGLVAVILTVDKRSGSLLTSPDIISRGFIYMRDSEELMNTFRAELRRAVQQRFKRIDLDRFKQEIKEHVTHFLFEQTGRSPIVIPVVNVVGGKSGEKPSNGGNKAPEAAKTPEQESEDLQKRFAQMRARLLKPETTK